jgi:hypothetical protein
MVGRRDSAVGIATGYGLNCRGVGVRVPIEAFFFLLPTSRPALGPTSPLIQWVRGLSLWGKSDRGVKLTSAPTSAEVKNTWICTSTVSYVVMA